MAKCKDHIKVSKGMIFAGCSFTWGQGLHYYSNMPNIKEPKPWHYDADLVRYSHFEYIKAHRTPRLVANHFDTFEVCQPWNGGAHFSIINYWNDCFGTSTDREKSINCIDSLKPKYDFDDFSHIIFQCTQWIRSVSTAKICTNSQGDLHHGAHIDTMQVPGFQFWLEKNNLTEKEYIHNAMVSDINDIRIFLQSFEERGVKAYIWTWPFDMVPYILEDAWLKERFITFRYKDINYQSIERLMGNQHGSYKDVNHPEMTVGFDIESFDELPGDHHPSKACHRMIADTIIKRIEQDINE